MTPSYNPKPYPIIIPTPTLTLTPTIEYVFSRLEKLNLSNYGKWTLQYPKLIKIRHPSILYKFSQKLGFLILSKQSG